MDGRPVWLASMSLSDRDGRIVGTGEWSERMVRAGHETLRRVLQGAGDRRAERLFRMNVTLCVHRALTAEEEAGLPGAFCAAEPIDIAGGPVEVLWENVPGRPSTRPCERPGHGVMNPDRQDLWVPVDCGECGPCRARAALGSYRPELLGGGMVAR